MENDAVPPDSNRGVQNTHSEPLIALVDWVSVTFPLVGGTQEKFENLGIFSAKRIIGLMGLPENEFKEMPLGMNGYKRQIKRGHISFLFDGSAVDMGVHMIMTGQGCREFEAEYKPGWPEFFSMVFWEKAHFTRLDLAVDDYKGFLKPEQIMWKLDNGLCSSRFKDYRYMKKGRISDGYNKGITIYFGSASSDIQIRIYDKLKERREAKKEIQEGVRHWVRTEVQLSDKRADMAASQIMLEAANGNTNIGVVIAGILKNYVTFYDKKTNDTNKSRWKKCRRWEKFLGDSAKLRLTLFAPDRTIGTRRAWIDKQTAKTLGMLFVAYDSDLDWLVHTLNRGMDLLEEKDIEEIDTYKRTNKIVDLLMYHERLTNVKESDFKTIDEYFTYVNHLQRKIIELEKKIDHPLESDPE